MGHVELIELRKSSIQCPSCLHHVLNGATVCRCGKLLRPNKDVLNRIKEAFEALQAPYYRTSSIVTRGSKCGPNPWHQHHHKARDALRSATKGERAGTDGNVTKPTVNSQLSHNWSDAWVRYLDHIAQFDMSHNAPYCQRERYVNLIHLRGLDSNKQAGPYNAVSAFATRVPGMVEYELGGAICGAAKFRTPTTISSSSSSWSPSPTWWSSSSWNQSWQKWHSHGWQDDRCQAYKYSHIPMTVIEELLLDTKHVQEQCSEITLNMFGRVHKRHR